MMMHRNIYPMHLLCMSRVLFMNRRIRKKKEIKLLAERNYQLTKRISKFKKPYKIAMNMARPQWQVIKKKNLNIIKVINGEYTTMELYIGINKEK